jgi:predicted phage replisome organizer
MADVKWIKITTDMFDNRKIKHLRRLPDGNNIVLIWVMLLTMAGRCNSGGMIFLTENIPYTPKMLADELDFEENTVRLALEALERLGMVVMSNGCFTIAGWSEHQNIDGMDKIRESKRLAQARWRAKQKALPPAVDSTVDSTVDGERISVDDAEEDIEEEREEEKERDKIDYKGIVAAFNSICVSFPSVKALSDARKKAIKARLNTYSIDDFKTLFEKAEASSFLKGKNSSNWSATFDWLIKDSNMAKVLDGNYDNKTGKDSARKEPVPKWMGDDLDRVERMLGIEPKTIGNDPELSARAESLKERLGQ